MPRFQILERIAAIFGADGGALHIHIRVEDDDVCPSHG
jgi:hypothetical protein